MKVGPRYKICKRLGADVFEKCQTQQYALSEARRGRAVKGRRSPLSDFGKQLLEKQKVRFTYGLGERQLSRYVKGANAKENASRALYETLESRLDNVVFRLGLASTRRFARQLVSHGHITINGRKITIPSFHVSVNDTIAVREGSREKTPFTALDERLAEHTLPQWLAFDYKTLNGRVGAQPQFEEGAQTPFDLGTVLEFYKSR